MIGQLPHKHHILLSKGHYLLVEPKKSYTKLGPTLGASHQRGAGRGQARGHARGKAKPAAKRGLVNLYARPAVPGRRNFRLRSPPRSPSPQPPPSPPSPNVVDLKQQLPPHAPERSVSPTMTFSAQVERERRYQQEQGGAGGQPEDAYDVSSSDEPTDRSDEDGDLNVYNSLAFPLRQTTRLTRTVRRPVTARTGRATRQLGNSSSPLFLSI